MYKDLKTGGDESAIKNVVNFMISQKLKTKLYVTNKDLSQYIINKQYVFFYDQHEIFFFNIVEEFDEKNLTKLNLSINEEDNIII